MEGDLKETIEMEEPKIAKGFDRGIDYVPMKKMLINEMKKQIKDLLQLDSNGDTFKKQQQRIVNRLIYLTISCIQLRNGSRITEACKAFAYFLTKRKLKVIVKIAKSEKKAYKIMKGNEIIIKNKTKARYRTMVFPTNWFIFDILQTISDTENYVGCVNNHRLEKRVLDYLLFNFNCNTHSLRYAFINYMLTKKKIPMATVAKMVGHVNPNQLCTYTQNKQVEEALNMDI